MKKTWGLFLSFSGLIITAIAFQNFAPSTLATTTFPVSLVDLVTELRPTDTSKKLPIFTDTSFTDGTACELSYQKTTSALPTRPPSALVPTDYVTPTKDNPNPTIKNVFSSSSWKVTSWVKNQSHPNLCITAAQNAQFESVIDITGPATILKTKAIGTQDNSFSLQLQQGQLVMGSRSVNFWQNIFGSPVFRSASDYLNVGWPSFFISKSMKSTDQSLLWLRQYSKLDFLFDGELAYANINTLTGSLLPGQALPPEAQLNYDPKIHATQFRLAILVQYRFTPDELNSLNCTSKIVTPDPVCAYHGKYLNYMIQFFDERFEYMSQWRPYWFNGQVPSKFMHDKGTNTMMYRESIENFMPLEQKLTWYDQNKNPYKLKANRFVLNKDIYPMIRQSILETESQVMIDPITHAQMKALPDRLQGTGPNGLETDNEYVGHFVISGLNLGYEVSGLSQIVFKVYNFKLTAN